MANRARGELEIKLGKKTYILRPDFERLESIEDAIGEPIHKFLNGVTDSKAYRLKDLFSIIRIALVDPNNDFEDGGLADALFEFGIYEIQAIAVQFLQGGMLGPKNLSELLEATESKKKARK